MMHCWSMQNWWILSWERKSHLHKWNILLKGQSVYIYLYMFEIIIDLVIYCRTTCHWKWTTWEKNSLYTSFLKTVTFHRRSGQKPLCIQMKIKSIIKWMFCGIIFQNPDGSGWFTRLSQIAMLILVLPHSNAEEEQVFSMVCKNKTAFRTNLDPLSSILTIKLANSQPAHSFEPTDAI